jgi:hypothetical protein
MFSFEKFLACAVKQASVTNSREQQFSFAHFSGFLLPPKQDKNFALHHSIRTKTIQACKFLVVCTTNTATTFSKYPLKKSTASTLARNHFSA